MGLWFLCWTSIRSHQQLKEKNGYKMNLYDPSIWNKLIKGSQWSLWKWLNLPSNGWNKIMKAAYLRTEVERWKYAVGKCINILKWHLNFTTKCQIKILMTDYIQDAAWDKARITTNNNNDFKLVQPKQKGYIQCYLLSCPHWYLELIGVEYSIDMSMHPSRCMPTWGPHRCMHSRWDNKGSQ